MEHWYFMEGIGNSDVKIGKNFTYVERAYGHNVYKKMYLRPLRLNFCCYTNGISSKLNEY